MMSIEEFDEIQEEHEFSDVYKIKKRKLIKKYREGAVFMNKTSGVAAAIVGLCILSAGTIYAAPIVYSHYFNDKGKVSTNIDVSANEENSDITMDVVSRDAKIKDIKLNFKYLPEGFENNYKEEYSFSDEVTQKSGIYVSPYVYDSNGEWNAYYVSDKKVMEVSNHKAILVKHNYTTRKHEKFIDMAVMYPEYNRVVVFYSFGDVSEEEVIKVAENMEIVETDNLILAKDANYSWLNYLNACNQRVGDYKQYDYEPSDYITYDKEMNNTHKINEEFNIKSICDENISVKVTDVKILDDASILEYIPEGWDELINEDGSINDENMNYIKWGDGVDSLNEVVKTESKKMKLVCVTSEYINRNDKALNDVLYCQSLLNLKHKSDKWYINKVVYDKDNGSELDYDDIEYDDVEIGFGEMFYYTPNYGGDDSNIYEALQPGESFTTCCAWLVPEDEIDNLYLNFGNGSYEFDDSDLELGYVDLNSK